MAASNNKTGGLSSRLARRVGKILGLILVFVLGFLLRWAITSAAPPPKPAAAQAAQAPQEQKWWTCSMHPQIKLPKPGLCPICQMKLIPMAAGESVAGGGLRRLSIGEDARKLMDVEVAPVERKFVTATVHMVGKVDYDETRLAYITAWVPGRLDRLYVDYTGISVNKGDHMVYLYSPELISAQEVLLRAIEAVKEVQATDLGVVQEMSRAMVKAAREKLLLWGLTPEQIAEIEKTGKVQNHLTIYAPIGGIVIHKNALEQMYVDTGTRLYTIADLSHVWVKLDAYESDLAWLRYGQQVQFTTVAYPGEIFTGTISFIDPVLNPTTRTVKVRVDAPNPDGKLKPEMFVKAVVKARLAAGGKVMVPELAGKWICPMHPSVVKDQPGNCDICEMPLVRPESVGYVSVEPAESEKPLVIPVSAALVTGTRAIVYVKVPDSEKPTYQGREIVLGPRAGDYYLVRSGLKEGEMVVVKGNFKIDSALQIQAKPSMMTPEGGGGSGGHNHGGMSMPKSGSAEPSKKMMSLWPVSRRQLQQVIRGSEIIKDAYKKRDIASVRAASRKLQEAVKAVDMKLLEGHLHMLWMEMSMRLENDAVEGKDVKTLRQAQRVIESLEANISSLKAKFGLMNMRQQQDRKATEVVEPAGGEKTGGPQDD